MAKTTKLTQQDLQIYPSERLTDTADGGGLMVGTPLTGKDNELFPPVSDVDRTMGSFDARLVYPAVLRNDAEPLYGAHFIIAQPPTADHVSFLAFKANKYGESRANIMQRIEAYSVPTIEGRMTLLGNHLAGSKLIQAYQRPEDTVPLPKVGERFCLRDSKDSRMEYFRIAAVSSEIRTFETQTGGNVREFQRRVIKMEITDALTQDFAGVDYPVEGYANPTVKILETQVADSANYYGVRPLAAKLDKGAASLRVDTIYEKLVPTSTVETAYADQYPIGSGVWVETGTRRQVASVSGSFNKDKLYLETSVLPGSVELSGYTDNARGQLSDGSNLLQVDYQNGVISGIRTLYNPVVYAVPATRYSHANYTAVINIDETNQGTEFTPFLKPRPARGSVQVAFVSQGEWYDLKDDGDYILRDSAGTKRGSITRAGSVLISLPQQPDVGSKLVVTWSPLDFYKTIDGQDVGNTIVPQSQNTMLLLPATPNPHIKAGTFSATWRSNGISKTATDATRGKITGDANGNINYAGGAAVIGAVDTDSISVSFERYTSEPLNAELQVNDGNISGTLGVCIPGTVQLSVRAAHHDALLLKAKNYLFTGVMSGGRTHSTASSSGSGSSGLSSNYGIVNLTLYDDGNGGLMLNGNKLSQASINYADGTIAISKDALKADVLSAHHQSIDIDNKAWAVQVLKDFKTVSKVTVLNAKATYLTDATSERVHATVNTGQYTFNVLQNKPHPRAALLNSWLFEIDGKRVIEQNGLLLTDFNAATGEGNIVGKLDAATGDVTFNSDKLSIGNLRILAGVYSAGATNIKQYYGRCPELPVKPQSFIVYAFNDGGAVMGQSDGDGNLTGEITGKIDYQNGFYTLALPDNVPPETLRFNVVTQSSVPLDSSIIGIAAVRLPPDGKIPIFRRGDMIVIGNRQSQNLGSSFTGGQIITLSRQDLTRVCLLDADGKHVMADKYSVDLSAGKITMAEPLSLAEYKMPLTAHHAQEEENRVVGVDINGTLKLQFPVSRDYALADSYVSSALIGGDLQVRHTAPISQMAWTNTWSDERIGDEILAKLNTKDYPITLTDAGTITERWLIRFTSATQFQLIGENLGLIAQSDTLSDLNPTNPATNKPYFSIPAAAFGQGWANGNCVRFNTYGTLMGVWILRAVQPSATPNRAKDGFSAALRGNTVELEG